MEVRVSSHLHSPPEAMNCEELHSSIPIKSFKDSSMASCLESFSGRGLSQNSLMSLFLNYKSAIIDTTVKETSLPITSRGSTDHGLPHGFWQQTMDHGYPHSLWWQHRTWNSMCSLLPEFTYDINRASSGNMNYVYQHGPRWQHRPQTPTWPPAAAWPMGINMAYSGSKDHGGLSRRPRK